MKKILYQPIFILVISLIAGIFWLNLRRSASRLNLSIANLDQLTQELAKWQQSVTQKKAALEEAKTPLAQEKLWRNDLLLQKEGEIVIQLPAIATPTPSLVPSPAQTPREEWVEMIF